MGPKTRFEPFCSGCRQVRPIKSPVCYERRRCLNCHSQCGVVWGLDPGLYRRLSAPRRVHPSRQTHWLGVCCRRKDTLHRIIMASPAKKARHHKTQLEGLAAATVIVAGELTATVCASVPPLPLLLFLSIVRIPHQRNLLNQPLVTLLLSRHRRHRVDQAVQADRRDHQPFAPAGACVLQRRSLCHELPACAHHEPTLLAFGLLVRPVLQKAAQMDKYQVPQRGGVLAPRPRALVLLLGAWRHWPSAPAFLQRAHGSRRTLTPHACPPLPAPQHLVDSAIAYGSKLEKVHRLPMDRVGP